jgi:hypothetical protein
MPDAKNVAQVIVRRQTEYSIMMKRPNEQLAFSHRLISWNPKSKWRSKKCSGASLSASFAFFLVIASYFSKANSRLCKVWSMSKIVTVETHKFDHLHCIKFLKFLYGFMTKMYYVNKLWCCVPAIIADIWTFGLHSKVFVPNAKMGQIPIGCIMKT